MLFAKLVCAKWYTREWGIKHIKQCMTLSNVAQA
jgi:hypothetical protein